MVNEQWPNMILDYVQPNRRRSGRPRKSWRQETEDAMRIGYMEELWHNTEVWDATKAVGCPLLNTQFP